MRSEQQRRAAPQPGGTARQHIAKTQPEPSTGSIPRGAAADARTPLAGWLAPQDLVRARLRALEGRVRLAAVLEELAPLSGPDGYYARWARLDERRCAS